MQTTTPGSSNEGFDPPAPAPDAGGWGNLDFQSGPLSPEDAAMLDDATKLFSGGHGGNSDLWGDPEKLLNTDMSGGSTISNAGDPLDPARLLQSDSVGQPTAKGRAWYDGWID
jgi:hypothetical protein